MPEVDTTLIEPTTQTDTTDDASKRAGESTPLSRVLTEGNLRVLPAFPLQKRRSARFQTKDGLVIRFHGPAPEPGGKPVLWEVRGPLQPSDKATFMAVESFITREFLSKHREVPPWLQIPSYRLLLRHRGQLTPSEWDIEDLKESLIRIKATTFISDRTWKSKRLDPESGHPVTEWEVGAVSLYDEVCLRGEERPDGTRVLRGVTIVLGRKYRANLNANHVIPLDYDLWRELRNPVARRLLELLSVKFYGMLHGGGHVLTLDYGDLCDRLPLQPQRYRSDAKQSLRRAHAELLNRAFLAGGPEWQWDRDARRIQYRPGRRFLEFHGHQIPLALDEQGRGEAPTSTLAQELTRRGVNQAIAARLVRTFPEPHIRRHLDIYDQRTGTNAGPPIGKPGAWLRSQIEQDWSPHDGYRTPEQRAQAKAREDARQAQEAADRAERERDRLEWEATPPEEKARTALDRWLAMRQAIKPAPTPDEIAVKHAELLREYQEIKKTR